MRRDIRRHRTWLIVTGSLCLLWLAGCTPTNRLSKVVRADPSAPLGYVEVHDRDSGIVSRFQA